MNNNKNKILHLLLLTENVEQSSAHCIPDVEQFPNESNFSDDGNGP